jgi:hypothetical protein
MEEGLRLFGAGRFFEAHEVWEGAWRTARGGRRVLLWGLIQVAAACHHLRRGRTRPAARLLARAGTHLEAAREGGAAEAGAVLRALEPLETYLRDPGPEGEPPWPRLPLPAAPDG